MKKSLIISLFFLAYLAPNTVFAQFSKLAGFDDKLIHFGFALSYNNADFYIQRSIEHQFADDSLQSLFVVIFFKNSAVFVKHQRPQQGQCHKVKVKMTWFEMS